MTAPEELKFESIGFCMNSDIPTKLKPADINICTFSTFGGQLMSSVRIPVTNMGLKWLFGCELQVALFVK